MGDESVNNLFRFTSELERVFASPEFARAPVMRRLLRFLVDQTVAGNGDHLKAYGVAVDGLGRDPDFDAQSDSYPRVQVGRLRRMLDAYYARYGMANGERIVIPNGAYRVFLHPVYRKQERPSPEGRAVPSIASPSREGEVEPAALFVPVTPTGKERKAERRGFRRLFRLPILSGAAALMLVAALAAFHASSSDGPAASPAASPLADPPRLLLMPVERSSGAPSVLATSIDQILGDALHRSWVADVVDVRPDGSAPPADYRLQSVLTGPSGEDLYITLWDARSEERLWTDHVPLGGRGSRAEDMLRIPIASLIGGFGAIATHERLKIGDRIGPGYPCLLKSAEIQRRPFGADLERARKCLSATLSADPMSVPALSAAADLNYRLAFGVPGQAERLRMLAESQAKQAMRLDPFSANAQMASATSAFIDGNCTLAGTEGLRAIDRNPYEPEFHARLGLMLFQCGDPDSESHLQAARAMDPSLPAFFSLPVVAAMGERGERDAALHLALSLPVGRLPNSPYYAMTMAVAYAHHGDRAKARAAWALVARAADGGASPRAILIRLLRSPDLARTTGEALIRAGVIERLD